MGLGAAPFVLIAALFVIGVPVLAIVAYVRVGAVKSAAQAEAAQLIRRIYALEQRLTQIEKGLSALAGPAAPIPPRDTADSPAVVAHPLTIPTAPSPSAPLPSQPPGASVVSPPPSAPRPPALSSPLSIPTAAKHGSDGNFEEMVAGR